MRGSLILYPKFMRIIVFQLSGFYYKGQRLECSVVRGLGYSSQDVPTVSIVVPLWVYNILQHIVG